MANAKLSETDRDRLNVLRAEVVETKARARCEKTPEAREAAKTAWNALSEAASEFGVVFIGNRWVRQPKAWGGSRAGQRQAAERRALAIERQRNRWG